MFDIKKTSLVRILISLPFLVILVFLFKYQIVQGAYFERIARFNFVRITKIIPKRGEIYDRNYQHIAINRPSINLYLIPAMIKDIDDIAQFLEDNFHLDPVELKKQVYEYRFRSYQELLLVQNVEYPLVVKISERLDKHPSLFFKTESMRNYTINNHFTGYVNKISQQELNRFHDKDYHINSRIGKAGLERVYEDLLRGKEGQKIIQVDAAGKSLELFKYFSDKEAENGNDILLTIDLKLQEYIEQIFPELFSGAVVVLDVQTGGILSYVTRPVYDNNIFSETLTNTHWNELLSDKRLPLLDRISMATYPPASLFKPVIAMVALEQGVISVDKTVNCTGSFRYGNQTYHCWHRPGHGNLNLVEAIKHSCNVYFYELSLNLKLMDIKNFMDHNRLIHKKNIDLPSERTGFFPDDHWYFRQHKTMALIPGHKINLSIGQGEVLMSPLQVACLYSAIANYGEWFTPHFFHNIIGADEKGYSPPPVQSFHLSTSEEVLKPIQEGMYKAVNERGGTALGARVSGCKVYGKTGTAQNPSGPNPHTWFGGYAVWDEPEIAVVVMFESVENGSGGKNAAPIAGSIINFYHNNIRKKSVVQ